VEESKEAQLEQVFKNIGYVLNEAGCTFDHVVKCTAFLTDMNDFACSTVFMPDTSWRRILRAPLFRYRLTKKRAVAEIEVIAKLPAK
jgi:2-iminobutanoate/2-iminopropanoate deaminase